MDEVLCGMQGASQKAAAMRLGPLSVRMGVARLDAAKSAEPSRVNEMTRIEGEAILWRK